jgi:ABC-type antimicrobial peptide transport system permease subunit
MIRKNLLRRKARTLLTVLGISIGVTAMILLGSLADGLDVGYTDMLTGSQADLVLSQPQSFDVGYSSVEAEAGEALAAMPEVQEVAGFLQGYTQAEGIPFFIVFAHTPGSFALDRYQLIDGQDLHGAGGGGSRGKPVMLGRAAAEALDKSVGDALRITGATYRIVGIYETGDALEDSGALMDLAEAQSLLGKPRQLSLFYIRLKNPQLADRLTERVDRLWPDLELSGASEFADRQLLVDVMDAYVWVIGGLAIVIGGVGMMNSQLMAVVERTREIGLLRAVGWSSRRVLLMILGESLTVGLLGGVLGIGAAMLTLLLIREWALFFGAVVNAGLILEALSVALVLGMLGGAYPAWRASRLPPVEALRYEGGSLGGVRRLPIGGMAFQSLWQRSARTLLTLGAIGLTVGAIMALEAVVRGTMASMTEMGLGGGAEIMVRQADIADTSLSAIDKRIGDSLAALPQVESVSGMIMTVAIMPDSGGFFIVMGYSPSEYSIRRFTLVEGKRISGNHQLMIGRIMAEAMQKDVGDTLEISGVRFRITGIYESGGGWEEMGGVVSLRDGQALAGRPRKVTLYEVSVRDPSQADLLVEDINARFPEVHSALTGEFADQMPDLKNAEVMINTISVLAIAVGGLGVLNTMLMAVMERTRELGILRALGWPARAVLGLILREAVLIGLLGGVAGTLVAFALTALMRAAPMVGEAFDPRWEWDVFVRAFAVAMLLGVAGGLYPAYRATRLQPVEALRYE